MTSSKTLTYRELESIKCLHNEPTRAASQLLNVVRNRPGIPDFLRALDETGHGHVRQLIETGNIQGIRVQAM